MPTPIRSRIERAIRMAEGYLELGLPAQAALTLERRSDQAYHSGRACYLWGESLRELGRFRDAIIPLERSAELRPEDMHVRLALGWCYKRIGRLRLAIATLEEALQHNPHEAILHYNLACYWSLARERSRSIGYLTRALDIDGHYRDLAADEPDFDPLRDDPEFRVLVSVIV